MVYLNPIFLGFKKNLIKMTIVTLKMHPHSRIRAQKERRFNLYKN